MFWNEMYWKCVKEKSIVVNLKCKQNQYKEIITYLLIINCISKKPIVRISNIQKVQNTLKFAYNWISFASISILSNKT